MELAYQQAPVLPRVLLTFTHTAAKVTLLGCETAINHWKHCDGFSHPLKHTSTRQHRHLQRDLQRPFWPSSPSSKSPAKAITAVMLNAWHSGALNTYSLHCSPHHCASSALPWSIPNLHICQAWLKCRLLQGVFWKLHTDSQSLSLGLQMSS